MTEDDQDSSKTSSFTVDNDLTGGGDMPSVTRLLNRKSLSISQPYTQAAPPPKPPAVCKPPPSPPPFSAGPDIISIDTETITHELEQSINSNMENASDTPQSGQPQAQIKRSSRKNQASHGAQLIVWQRGELSGSADPLSKGIATLLDAGAQCALFLSITPPPSGCQVPHFKASAVVAAPTSKISVWTGMKWDPTVAPDAWNYFVKTGFIELAPPGTLTNMKSNRNIIRAAFGIGKNEYLILVRAGPPTTCRGVLAIVASSSMQTKLAAAIPLVTALPPKQAA
jgi:hypothetical protein